MAGEAGTGAHPSAPSQPSLPCSPPQPHYVAGTLCLVLVPSHCPLCLAVVGRQGNSSSSFAPKWGIFTLAGAPQDHCHRHEAELSLKPQLLGQWRQQQGGAGEIPDE